MKSDDPPISNGPSSFLLYSTVALAPLPFGSTDPSATAVWCILLGLSLVLLRPVGLQRAHLLLAGLAVVVIAAYAVAIHEQISEHPWFGMLLPHPFWQESSSLLKVTLTPLITVARNQPWLALGPPISTVLALACAFLVSLERVRARQLLKVVAWSGVVYAVFGIASYISDPTKVLWRDKQAYAASLTATFTNRNTAAVYFGICALIWQLMVAEKIDKILDPAEEIGRNLWRRILLVKSRNIVLYFSMFVLCLAVIFLTTSRAGVVFSLAAMAAAPPILLWRRLSRKGGVAIAIAALLGVALLLLETVGSGVNARFDLDPLASGGRWEAYKSTLHIISDYPWLGTGLGTFAWVFPSYRSGSVSIVGVWDRAHNTLLELTSELGIPLATLVVFAWIVVLAVLIHGIRKRRRDVVFPVAGFVVAVLALLHSSVDFSLQIPGFSIPVAAILGCGLAQSFRSVKQGTGEEVRQSRRRKSSSEMP